MLSPDFESVLPEEYLETRPLVKLFLDAGKQISDLPGWKSEVIINSNQVRDYLQGILGLDGWDNTTREVYTNLVNKRVLMATGGTSKSELQVAELLLTVGYQMGPELQSDFLQMYPLQERIVGQLWGMRALRRQAYEITLPNKPGHTEIMNSIYRGMGLLGEPREVENKPVIQVPDAFLRAFND